ncbi:VIR protein [Plasmodium vivax]|uniref:VIR protein n=1 Tax=Plasmodium vivax TaxID=5855 RepID=A0A1G4E970_PLAVI|nr:VIR protein [Plasmodium vivax]
MYKNFDKPVDDDKYEGEFDVLCNQIVTTSNGGLPSHKYICKKLMRNLGVYYLEAKFYELNHDQCKFIYNWIYDLMNKNKITYNVIHKCFDMYDEHMNGIKNFIKRCYHFPSYNIYEPIKITLLDIFDNYTPTIKEKLMNQHESISTTCQKYICECVKIYDDMHQNYCLKKEEGNEKQKNTCSRLESFKKTYKLFFQNNQDLKDKIPSIHDEEIVTFSRCPTEEKEARPREAVVSRPGSAQEVETRSAVGIAPRPTEGIGPSSTIVGAEKSDNPIPFNTTSVVSAMAGIPPFLALIYKFTPVGTMLRKKNKQSINAFNHLDEEIEKELFFRRLENGTINYSPETYNVAYGRV